MGAEKVDASACADLEAALVLDAVSGDVTGAYIFHWARCEILRLQNTPIALL